MSQWLGNTTSHSHARSAWDGKGKPRRGSATPNTVLSCQSPGVIDDTFTALNLSAHIKHTRVAANPNSMAGISFKTKTASEQSPLGQPENANQVSSGIDYELQSQVQDL